MLQEDPLSLPSCAADSVPGTSTMPGVDLALRVPLATAVPSRSLERLDSTVVAIGRVSSPAVEVVALLAGRGEAGRREGRRAEAQKYVGLCLMACDCESWRRDGARTTVLERQPLICGERKSSDFRCDLRAASPVHFFELSTLPCPALHSTACLTYCRLLCSALLYSIMLPSCRRISRLTDALDLARTSDTFLCTCIQLNYCS